MKKTIILACAALVMSAAAVMGYKTYNESKQLTLMEANIEALTQAESGMFVDCFMNFDTPAWFVDDQYKVVCRDPNTGELCKQIKGHDFSNPSKCDWN